MRNWKRTVPEKMVKVGRRGKGPPPARLEVMPSSDPAHLPQTDASDQQQPIQVPTCVSIHDAHLHTLRHIDVTIPHGQLVAFTGISGSGKSSLAFGTIHGEGQRSYLESVAPFARRLISQATDPQVGSIEGLSPTVALQQQTTAPSRIDSSGSCTIDASVATNFVPVPRHSGHMPSAVFGLKASEAKRVIGVSDGAMPDGAAPDSAL